MPKKHRQRGRKDHYVPQGYLRGFVDPERADLDKPLWHLDTAYGVWSEKSASEVGWEKGFYDYAQGTNDLEHPDVTFAMFEREFPLVRERMLQRRFKNWVPQHRSFLLHYMKMLRARSPMFIHHQTEQNRALRGSTITSVGPGNQITVDSLELRPFSERLVRNATISQMRDEIGKGPDWMWDFNWCLRYTSSTSDPFITGKQPILLESLAPTWEMALLHPDTLIWFPLCWQACLIGSLRRFDVGTYEADPMITSHQRELFRRHANPYIVSPQMIM